MRLTGNTHRKARYDYALKKITARLYDGIDLARALIVKGLSGVSAANEREVYSTILIYRIIFLFFIQKTMLPTGENDYLERNFSDCLSRGVSYYRSFLVPLFFNGTADYKILSGRIFNEEDIEIKRPAIDAENGPFGSLLEFLGGYEWRIDEGPLINERQVNLEVLGYLFEKYGGAKGAYYTKEATGLYLARGVIVPALAERFERWCAGRGINLASIITLKFSAGPADYFSPHLIKGYFELLPKKIQRAARRFSDGAALSVKSPDRFGECGETWRDVLCRRRLVSRAIKELSAEACGQAARTSGENMRFSGAAGALERMIAHNIDIMKLLLDAIAAIDSREALAGFLRELVCFRVLDIAAGSGALLFAAMKVLANFYSAVLARIAIYDGGAHKALANAISAATEAGGSGCGPGDTEVNYSVGFLILKVIIERNLYGIEVMREAVMAAQTRFALAMCAKLSGERVPIGAASTAAFNVECGDSLAGDGFYKTGKAAPLDGYASRSVHDGFDAIICNPPFMSIKKMATFFSTAPEKMGAVLQKPEFDDAFVLFVLKSLELGSPGCRYGFIMPLSATYGVNSRTVRKNLGRGRINWVASFDNIPSPLFAGVSQRICLWIASPAAYAGEGIYFSTPLWRWRSIYSKKLMERIVYTPVNDAFQNEPGERLKKNRRSRDSGIIRIEDEFQLEFVKKIESFETPVTTPARKRYGQGYTKLGYSHAARNFISAYIGDGPPCYDPKTLAAAPPARATNIRVRSELANAALAALNSEAFFFYWLSRADGFNVSGALVSEFLKFTLAAPQRIAGLLERIGCFMHERRNEALRFKKNAGKLVGNFNFREVIPELCRRADLLIFMSLGLSFEHYYSVFDYIQRMISLNVNEKRDDPIISGQETRAPAGYDTALYNETLAVIDRLCSAYFGISAADIKAICGKYYMSSSGKLRPR